MYGVCNLLLFLPFESPVNSFVPAGKKLFSFFFCHFRFEYLVNFPVF